MSFMGKLERTADRKYNMSVTENGAIGHRTTGSKLLDMNFKLSSYRNVGDAEIINDFREAFREDPVTAMKWLFYVRDVREGQGERRFFRTVIMNLCSNGFDRSSMESLISLVPEYGRWDDLWCLLETSFRYSVVNLVEKTLVDDMKNCNAKKSVSLLAKWMPSENTSSKTTRRYAQILRAGLQINNKCYRRILSKLRSYIDVTEVKMSGNRWQEIDYESVPSRANLIYKDAFMRHDAIRRVDYLDALSKGKAKINSSVLYPHDIVHKYNVTRYGDYTVDDSLEEMWKNLPNLVNGDDSTIVVADGSGSMCARVGNTMVSALEVANSLAIYFAERCNGEFKNKYITFSEHPRIVNIGSSTLKSKISTALHYNECANTNIEAVFDLILDTAVRNHMNQDDIPHNILIISDMEFDSCAESNSGFGYDYYNRRRKGLDSSLFENIADKYERYGYKIPRLIFWNVCSRTNTIPMKENDLGVTLVSGFSVNTMKMVMSNKTDPYEALMDILNSDRYDPIGKAMSK